LIFAEWINVFKRIRSDNYQFSGFLFLVLLMSGVISAAPPEHKLVDIQQHLQQQVQQMRLWQHQEWLNLLHYYKDSGNPNGYTSAVDDARFFNATDGKTSPEAELQATLLALYRRDISGNDHAQCRFVARLHWLQKQLSIDMATLPKINCPDYVEWYAMVKAQRATLIFPTYHLNSPSSMFGHTLLRLDHSTSVEDSSWLSFAVNFGANANAEDNSLFYAFKGLTGGYPGIFIVAPYFKKIQEYNRIEKRDIWEYQLDLSPEEVDRMVTHLWELKEINFDYYFFDENCSYRLLELLEVARPGIELTDEFGVTAIPIDTVKAIERVGMIESRRFRPARVTELSALIKTLSDTEQTLMQQLAVDPDVFERVDFATLNDERKARIIDVAYRYQRYQQSGKARNDEQARNSHRLLALLNRYPDNIEPSPVVEPLPPELGHHSRRISISAGERDNEGFAEVAMRMAFHSLEDNEHGFLRGAQINMANVQLRVTDSGDFHLQQLDVIDIVSLTSRSRFFQPMSWKVYTGLERQITDGKDRLTAHVTGGWGASYSLADDGLFYALATGRLEHNRGLSTSGLEPALGVDSGFLWHFGKSTTRLELSGEHFWGDHYRTRVRYGQNFVVARNHGINFSADYNHNRHDRYSQFSLAYRYYF